MQGLIVFGIMFMMGVFLLTLHYFEDKNNKKRYAPILYRLKQGRRYPYWRLEEMLEEETNKQMTKES